MARKNFFDSRPMFVAVNFGFDPFRDMQEVEQFGFVNLAQSFDKGIIPGGLDLTEESFNGVHNPGTLISRSMDVFDGLRKRDYVSSQLAKLNAAEREKAESAMYRAAEKEVHVEVSSEG
jgi:hypothetical protein